jgi:outer membrane biosynthesis protein TonB
MDGSVSQVSLERSSARKQIDDAVLDATRKSTYRPLKSGCGPIESTETVIIDVW